MILCGPSILYSVQYLGIPDQNELRLKHLEEEIKILHSHHVKAKVFSEMQFFNDLN